MKNEKMKQLGAKGLAVRYAERVEILDKLRKYKSPEMMLRLIKKSTEYLKLELKFEEVVNNK